MKKNYKIDDDFNINLGKVPPQAIELEEVVLGAIILERDAINKVIDILTADVFYKDQNKKIFLAILDLYNDETKHIDLLTVVNQLKKRNDLESVGGPYYISSLTNRVVSSANIEFHARIILQEYIKREMISMSAGVQIRSYKNETDPLEILETAQKNIDDVTKLVDVGKITTITELFFEAEKRNTEIISKEGLSGVPSGFTEIDNITGGWQNSDLIILAARPGMGKTSLAINFARNAAIDFDCPVAVFSLEMASMQLMQRMMSSETGISLEKYMRKGLDDQEVQFNRVKCGPLSSAKIFIEDKSGISIFELKIKLRKLKRDHNIKLAVIDYVQLMTVGSGADVNGREQEVGYISRNLKSIAKDLNIPIIILSQLSRKVEERADKEPMLSDLRESGSLEQDADMVMFIYRPEYYGVTEDGEGSSTIGKAQIKIAKHRNGATTDEIIIGFKSDIVKFHNLVDDNPFAEQNEPRAEQPNFNSNLKPNEDF
jgi:replicative DNA helicase